MVEVLWSFFGEGIDNINFSYQYLTRREIVTELQASILICAIPASLESLTSKETVFILIAIRQ